MCRVSEVPTRPYSAAAVAVRVPGVGARATSFVTGDWKNEIVGYQKGLGNLWKVDTDAYRIWMPRQLQLSPPSHSANGVEKNAI